MNRKTIKEMNKMKAQYRYYSDSLSRKMVPSLKRHLPKIGEPMTVRGVCQGKFNGWYEVIVTGKLGKLVLRGCSWGYGGEGPHATRDVLVALGVNKEAAETVAFTTPNGDVGQGGTVKTRRGKFRGAAVGKEYFRLHLLVQPRWHDVYNRGRFHAAVLAASPDAALLECGALGCPDWTANLRGQPWRYEEAA